MKVERLSGESTRETGFTHKITITASTDFVATDTGTTKTIAIYPATGNALTGTLVQAAATRVGTEFDASDASINSLFVEVGDGGSTGRFIPASTVQLCTDNTVTTHYITPNSADTLPHAYTSDDTIDAKFTVAGGGSPTMSEVNSGEVYIYLRLYDLDNL